MSQSIATRSQPKLTAPLIGVDVHAVHKSGTMFLFNFFGSLAKQYDFDFYSANNEPANEDDLPKANQRDFCRCPIRTFETVDSAMESGSRRQLIFHVRDPRDILVSEYFSIGWIHPTQGTDLDRRRETFQKMSIDEYVLNQSEKSSWPLREKFEPLLRREFNPEFETLVTYETMVTNFQRWAEQVLRPFGIRFPRLAAIKLAWRYRNEFKVASESMTHKRRIAPGDHRDKLKPATIEALNQRFEPILKRFGYLD